MKIHFYKKPGFSLIEVLIALVILTAFAGAVAVLFLSTVEGSRRSVDYTRATLLASEGIEAMRTVRDNHYLNLVDGAYGLVRGTTYTLGPAPEIIDGVFERTVEIASVYRDARGEIAASGTLEPNMKRITVSVTFPDRSGLRRDVELSTYLGNWRTREIVHTLRTDFGSVERTNIEVINSAAPPMDNGALRLTRTFVADGFYSSADIGHHGTDVVVTADRAYAFVTAASETGGLVVIDIRDPRALRVVTRVNIGGRGRGLALQGMLLAVGVGVRSQGLVFVDVSVPTAPRVLSRFNLGDAEGRNVVLHGDIAYVTSDRSRRTVIVVDAANPSAPAVVTSLNLDGYGFGIARHENLLFVGVDNRDGAVLDITDPRAPRVIHRFDTGSDEHPTSFTIDYPHIFMSLASGDSELGSGMIHENGSIAELSFQNLSNDDARDVSRSEDLLALASEDVNRGVIILDIAGDMTPRVLEQRDIDAKGRGVALIPPYIAVATDTANEGFILIGSGTRGFASTGTYVSPAIDIGTPSPEYHSIRFDAIIPPTGAVAVEVRAAATIAALSAATWVGPYIASPSRVSLPNARYFQYRVTLTGDASASPIFDELTIEYLP